MLPEKENQYEGLINQIGIILNERRLQAAQSVNIALVHAYWEIGRYIVEFEQKGKERAEYGTRLYERLSKDLTQQYNKGFNRSNLANIRKLYIIYPIFQTVSGKLSWSHYCELI